LLPLRHKKGAPFELSSVGEDFDRHGARTPPRILELGHDPIGPFAKPFSDFDLGLDRVGAVYGKSAYVFISLCPVVLPSNVLKRCVRLVGGGHLTIVDINAPEIIDLTFEPHDEGLELALMPRLDWQSDPFHLGKIVDRLRRRTCQPSSE
jgi:hypothetical protein